MIKTNKRMASIAKDIDQAVTAKQEIAIEIVQGQVDKVSYEVESKRGLNTLEERISVRYKHRDRRNLGKEKSQRMHWQAACKIDNTAKQKAKRKKLKEAKKNAKVS